MRVIRSGEIINHIQERLAATIETAGLAGESVAFQTEALNNTVDVFKNISQQVSKLAEDVEKITQSVGGIEQAKEDTMNAIESISTTSNQTESASEELARSTEKQLQAVEVLNDAVKRLQMDAEDYGYISKYLQGTVRNIIRQSGFWLPFFRKESVRSCQ